VNPDLLKSKGLLRGRNAVKVLANGELSKPLKIKAHAFSKAAEEQIRKVGGSAEKIVPTVRAETAHP